MRTGSRTAAAAQSGSAFARTPAPTLPACALRELKIRILCIPFTPSTATKQWVITIYQDTISAIADNRNVYVGNNELANRAAASLWQRCRGQLSRKEILCCNAGSVAPCATEI